MGDPERCDIATKHFSEREYADHPTVNTAGDIWQASRPYMLVLRMEADGYLGNCYLLIDGDRPNPHDFQLFTKASGRGYQYMHTEFVG